MSFGALNMVDDLLLDIGVLVLSFIVSNVVSILKHCSFQKYGI